MNFWNWIVDFFRKPMSPSVQPSPLTPKLLLWPVKPNRGVRQNDAAGSGAYGASRDGGSRKHLGIDLIARPGDDVCAPCRCEVTHVGLAYPGASYGSVRLKGWDSWRAYTFKLLYVAPEVTIGEILVAGEILGVAQDISLRYPGITSHIHFETHNAAGPFDPATLLDSAT